MNTNGPYIADILARIHDHAPAKFTEDGIENLKELIPMHRKKAAPADPTRP